MINLKIYEENNNLLFKESYSPVVCGNSNYQVEFEFGADWQAVEDKTAIIIVGGKKTAKDFSGNTLTLPAIPNCNSFLLIVFSAEGETTRLVSSPVSIDATPTTYAEALADFEPLTTYVSELLTKVKNLIDGTTKVKNAENADIATTAITATTAETANTAITATTATTATTAETANTAITATTATTANTANTAETANTATTATTAETANTANTATTATTATTAETANTAKNVSNPNLLLNGDFKINQRGQTSYVCTKNEYTVDRWLGASGLTVTKNSNSITLTNTNTSSTIIFQQKLEESFLSFAGKTLCLSATVGGTLYYATATLPTSAPSSATMLISKQISDGVTLQLAYLSTSVLSVQISLSAEKTLSLTNIKLEIGSSPTTFCPRLYAEELIMCQRYFKKYSGLNNATVGQCSARHAGALNFIINTGKFRTTPTMSYSGNLKALVGSSTISNLTPTYNSYFDGIVKMFLLDTENPFSNGLTYTVAINSESFLIEFDAEIY